MGLGFHHPRTKFLATSLIMYMMPICCNYIYMQFQLYKTYFGISFKYYALSLDGFFFFYKIANRSFIHFELFVITQNQYRLQTDNNMY